MTLFLILIIVCLVAAGVSLWFSGYLARPASTPASTAPAAAPVYSGDAGSDQQRISELETLVASMREEQRSLEYQTKQAVEDKVNLDDEVARLNVELEQLESNKGQLELEIEHLKAELETTKQRPKPKLPVPQLPHPSGAAPVHHANDEFDTLTAQLDMERVAHQKTREELELLKKAPVAAPPERRAFPTMAFAARTSLTGTEDDGLQKSLERIQAEKDEIEAELSRAKQELQILKMRQ